MKNTKNTKSIKPKYYSGIEKVKAVRLHLLEAKPVSEICDSLGICASMYHKWQKKFFENGAYAFDSQSPNSRSISKYKTQISSLETKLSKKDEVISEIMEEHIKVKKLFGEI